MPLISIVFGTRPEAIKLAPVIRKFKEKGINIRVICTGQHEDLIKPIMEIFNIKEDLNLHLMKEKQSLNSLLTRIIESLSKEFVSNRPDLVVVQGDTTSALGASICAFHEKINLAHVEAGLRTNCLLEPFPEEANRRLISQISHLNFAPTKSAKINLLKENISDKIFITGNTVVDALLYIVKKKKKLNNNFQNINFKNLILITIHRRENWGDRLKDICMGLKKIIEKHKDYSLILPMHPNPVLRKKLEKNFGADPRVNLIDSLPYDEFIFLMNKCKFIITDSGGLQEEAPSLNKPLLVLRENTERNEAIETGAAKLIGINSDKIFYEANQIIINKDLFDKMSYAKNPFGDGKASEKIVKECLIQINKK